MSSNSISVRELARIAGVSPSTVSLALRDSPKIPKETIARIRQIGKEHGYQRNPRLSRILAETVNSRYDNRGEVICCLETRQPPERWNAQEGPIVAMAKRCSEYGYQLEPFWIFQPGMSAARANQILWARRIAGLVVLSPSYSLRKNGRLTLPIEWERFAAVEIDDVMTEPTLNRVRHSHLSGIWTAIRELERFGCRRIGLCMVEDVEYATHHRWTAGYLYWAKVRGYAIAPLMVPSYSPKEIARWIKKNRLDAVISPGIQALAQMRLAGLDVPGEVCYASLDLRDNVEAKEYSALGPGAVAGIDQGREVQFGLAIDLLVTMIHRGQKGAPVHPTTWTSAGEWKDGASCRRIPEAPPIGDFESGLLFPDPLMAKKPSRGR